MNKKERTVVPAEKINVPDEYYEKSGISAHIKEVRCHIRFHIQCRRQCHIHFHMLSHTLLHMLSQTRRSLKSLNFWSIQCYVTLNEY